MMKRMMLMLALVVVFIAAVAFLKYTAIRKGMAMGAKFAPPPTAVTTVKVKAQTWQPVLSAVGSLKAVHGVTVSTDLAGIVSEIAFESGTAVKKGDGDHKHDHQHQHESHSFHHKKKVRLAGRDGGLQLVCGLIGE